MDNLSFYTNEYQSLKNEQLKRIEFRDNIIYLTLVSIGSIFAFCFEKPQFHIAFLVLPYFCIIMGWTYYTNDRKVTSIGEYINKYSIPIIEGITNQTIPNHWENKRKEEPGRKFRKNFQLLIDISLFCFSSVTSIVVFYSFHECVCWPQHLVAITEIILILILSFLFWKNSQT